MFRNLRKYPRRYYNTVNNFFEIEIRTISFCDYPIRRWCHSMSEGSFVLAFQIIALFYIMDVAFFVLLLSLSITRYNVKLLILN